MLAAGGLNKRVTIEAPQRIENDLGEHAITWVPVIDVWASITPLNARETVRARQAQLTTTHVVCMRYTSELHSDCRLTYSTVDGTRILNIAGIVNVREANRELEVQCIEVTGG